MYAGIAATKENTATMSNHDSIPQDVRQQIDRLHAEGVLTGGHGPRETLRPVAHVPGALARFLARRNAG